ncbi:MAG: PfkB family carbohydrate kinase [Chloroflexota bacterium]
MASSPAGPARPVYGPPPALPGAAVHSRADQRGSGPVAPVIEPRAAEPRRVTAGGPVPTVVVAGSASRDVDVADPRGWRLGGGATYGALALARLGLRVGVVLGVDEAAAGAHELDLLRAAGAELHLARLPAGPVFHLQETAAGRSLRCDDPGEPLPVAALPPTWRAAPAWLLSPVADELPDGWAAIPPGAIVALDWQGILRDLARGAPVRPRPAAPRALLRRADLVSVSTEDLQPGADLRGLLRLLRTGALCTLTRGGRGGLAFAVRPGAPRMRQFPAVPATVVVDTTGAGDVFLAALLAARTVPALAGRRPHLLAAVRFAATVAAVHVGAPGLAGVPTLEAVHDALRRPAPA